MEYQFSDRVSNLKPSAIREIFKYAADPSVVSLSAGNPSPDAFPVKEIAEISARIFKENPISVLQYSITEGYTPLRNHLKEYMSKNLHNRESVCKKPVCQQCQRIVENAQSDIMEQPFPGQFDLKKTGNEDEQTDPDDAEAVQRNVREVRRNRGNISRRNEMTVRWLAHAEQQDEMPDRDENHGNDSGQLHVGVPRCIFPIQRTCHSVIFFV